MFGVQKNTRIVKGNKGKAILLSKGTVCSSKKPRFIKELEASELLSSLGIKTGLDKIPVVGSLLF